jgi:ParB family chromosome partitioning protein
LSIKIREIDISPDNVRRHDRDAKIGELANSIEKHGLLQPVVVVEKKDGRYDLVIGQRRLEAHQKLVAQGKHDFAEIAAIVLPKMDHFHARLYSLGENMHRVQLNRADIMKVIKYLYEHLGKSVRKVSEELGVSPETVRGYLKLERAATEEMKRLIRRGKLTKSDAERIIQAAGSDEKNMNELAKRVPGLTKPEKQRLVEAAWQRPKATPEEWVKEAKAPRYSERLVVQMTPAEYDALENAASKEGRSREELAKVAILGWLRDRGYYRVQEAKAE